jgi:hypothetical protein
MTAIIGYTHRGSEGSIGILCSDDLEGTTKMRVDKLVKLSGNFTIGTVGLRAVDDVICSFIAYFDQFSGSKIQVSSIDKLESLLNEVLPITFRRLKGSYLFEKHKHQVELSSEIVVLDLAENRLYHADLGKVWRIDENPNYYIKLRPLLDGLYSFGIIKGKEKYLFREYAEFNSSKVLSELENMMSSYNSDYKDTVGNIGALQVNQTGSNSFESFYSGFKSWQDRLDNYISFGK